VLKSFKTLTAPQVKQKGVADIIASPADWPTNAEPVGLARRRTKGQMENADIGLCASLKGGAERRAPDARSL
jgi:hypothetical protein